MNRIKQITILRRLAIVLLIAPMMSNSINAADQQQIMDKAFRLNTIGIVQKKGNNTRLALNQEVEPALLGLDGFSHVWVFWWFDRNDTPEKRAVLQVHPRGNKKNPLTGVFATRSPVRPNLIAQSLCRVVKIEGTTITIESIDAFDSTPILDIKPFIPAIDQADAEVPAWIGR